MPSRLGQNFLVNKEAIKKIVQKLKIAEKDLVVEIGPGKGALTFPLLKSKLRSLVAIEKDAELAEELIALKEKRLEVIIGDALVEMPAVASSLGGLKYKLIGNLPYYITGYFFRTLAALDNKPELAVFMIQKEVAQRMTAEKGKMNLLAAAMQIWAEIKIEMTLGARDFKPEPKVSSAVISLKPKVVAGVNLAQYYTFIKILFKQPRKTILNNLRAAGYAKEIIEERMKEMKIKEEARAESLDLETIVKFSEKSFV